MRSIIKKYTALILTVLIICSVILPASAATGYTKAEDVRYVTTSGKVANWGSRGEDCLFLSKYAVEFYTGSASFENISKKAGGTTQSNAQYSQLYNELGTLMTSRHTHITNYNETRDLYKYTDCTESDTAHISSFYSSTQLSGTWDGGDTWNREHTWPNSKGLNGSDEDDIMMLRPTSVKENSSRGNKAYGESADYFNPDCNSPAASVKGDCARIVLYIYTRWGNTGAMWGKSGVIENLDVLLKWMAEDPVDTWEMGRNDAVQSITGTRNVFVDYPEYAFLLFGREIPESFVSPSNGKANAKPVTPDSELTEPPVIIPDGPSGDTATYVFENYDPGIQYAKDELHQLDKVLSVTTTDCHFREELRFYYSTNTTYGAHYGSAVFASTRVIESFSINAGNKNATFKISGSTDGNSFTPIKELSVKSAYADYDISIKDLGYKFIKLDVVGAQLRIKSITMNYAGASSDSTTAPTQGTTEPTGNTTDTTTSTTTGGTTSTSGTVTETAGETTEFTIPSITTPDYGKKSNCGSFAASGAVVMLFVIAMAGAVIIKRK